MYPPERSYTSVLENIAVAMADKVADVDVDEETDARSSNLHTTKWRIILPKHGEKGRTLKLIQIPPGTTCGHATTAVSQYTSKPTKSTSNMPGINPTRSTMAHYLPCSLQQEMSTSPD
jgi:hypothetical protein